MGTAQDAGEGHSQDDESRDDPAGSVATATGGQRRLRRSPGVMAAAGGIGAAVLVLVIGAVVSGAFSTKATSGSSGEPACHVSTVTTVETGRPAPAFTCPSLDPGQGQVSLGGRPGGPVIVNFFASWCPPCRKELPLLAEAYDSELPGRGSRSGSSGAVRPPVEFIGVDTNDSASAARALVKESGVRYRIAFDPSATLANGPYELFGLPDTIFIARDGNVAHIERGQLTKAVLDHWMSVIEASR